MRQPGRHLRALAARCCSRSTMERLIDPIVSDLQSEYRDACARGPWHGRRLLLASYLAFWKAVIWNAALVTCGVRGGVMARTIALSLAAFVVITVLFVMPPFIRDVQWDDHPDRGLLALYLVPQALPLSLPAGLCVGVLGAMRGRALSTRHLFVVLGLGIVASILVLMAIEWLIPAGNQAFRNRVASQLQGRTVDLEPGVNELGLRRLATRTDVRSVHRLQLLLALCFAAIPLSTFALGLAAHVRRAWSGIAVAVLAWVGYMLALMLLDEMSPDYRFGVSPVLQLWVPNILFLVAGVGLLRNRGTIVRA